MGLIYFSLTADFNCHDIIPESVPGFFQAAGKKNLESSLTFLEAVFQLIDKSRSLGSSLTFSIILTVLFQVNEFSEPYSLYLQNEN